MAGRKQHQSRNDAQGPRSKTARRRKATKDFAPAAVWDVEAVAGLLEAVCFAGGELPERFRQPIEQLDPGATHLWREAMAELASELSLAFTWKSAWPDLTDERTANANARALAQLRGQLERVRARLAERPYLAERLSQNLPFELADATEVVGELLAAVGAVSREMAAFEGLIRTNLTPQGVSLASLIATYQRTFGSEATVGVVKTWGSYGGPFVAFVRKAHEIAGCPITEQALTTALQRHTEIESRVQ